MVQGEDLCLEGYLNWLFEDFLNLVENALEATPKGQKNQPGPH